MDEDAHVQAWDEYVQAWSGYIRLATQRLHMDCMPWFAPKDVMAEIVDGLRRDAMGRLLNGRPPPPGPGNRKERRSRRALARRE